MRAPENTEGDAMYPIPLLRTVRVRSAVLLLAAAVVLPSASASAEPAVKVVTTLSAYASIAREVGGDRVEVASISSGVEDAHFVKPKPSYALMLKDADLFVSTGLDLELWAPTLVDKSGNRRIRDGEPGYVSASQGVPLLDVPTSADRAAGDVHLFGNPHIFTSPLNAKIIAGNIAAGLERVDPAGATSYRANLERFKSRLDESLYGEELPELLGAQVLDPLAAQGKLVEFLEGRDYEGEPLLDRLGGWLGKGRVFRDGKIVAYHKNWIYFAGLFGLDVVDYVEPKPGIPPSARHVHELLERIGAEGVRAILAASYFSQTEVQAIAERSGIPAVQVPLGTVPGGPEDYFALVDRWVDGLVEAFSR
jgi:zinc/manganese transport system substrate-binding protein